MQYKKKCKTCNLTKQLNKFNLRNAKRTKTCSSCLNKNRLSRLKKKNKIDKNQLKLKVVKSLKRTVLPPTIYSVCIKNCNNKGLGDDDECGGVCPCESGTYLVNEVCTPIPGGYVDLYNILYTSTTVNLDNQQIFRNENGIIVFNYVNNILANATELKITPLNNVAEQFVEIFYDNPESFNFGIGFFNNFQGKLSYEAVVKPQTVVTEENKKYLSINQNIIDIWNNKIDDKYGPTNSTTDLYLTFWNWSTQIPISGKFSLEII